jgi:hypothetical protein
MNEGHETPAPAASVEAYSILKQAHGRHRTASLGSERCFFCSRPALQRYGEGSIRCWWCEAIYPRKWLIDRLMERSEQKLTGQKKSP